MASLAASWRRSNLRRLDVAQAFAAGGALLTGRRGADNGLDFHDSPTPHLQKFLGRRIGHPPVRPLLWNQHPKGIHGRC